MSGALVIGAGVGGLCTALALQQRGVATTLVERSAKLGEAAASWIAGGMLAPYCEGESATEEIVRLGEAAIDWWETNGAQVSRTGTLVVASPRDAPEIERFAARTVKHRRLDEAAIAELEPELEGRFRRGLFFAGEGHLDPRAALSALLARFEALGGIVRFGTEMRETRSFQTVLDCRGFAARDALPELRPVRGEALMLRARDVHLTRCVRFLHPRMPLYVVPRGEGLYMVGATMIESGDRSGVSARSAIELLSAAYALHPGFGEAEIIEMHADVRPAFPDNVPRIVERGGRIYVNGFYRHGFLLSPVFAERAAELVARAIETEPHLGEWLGENAPRVGDIEFPSRHGDRPDPFANRREDEFSEAP
jgi:glycine oxidase